MMFYMFDTCHLMQFTQHIMIYTYLMNILINIVVLILTIPGLYYLGCHDSAVVYFSLSLW